jgi:hypothetical protein
MLNVTVLNVVAPLKYLVYSKMSIRVTIKLSPNKS